MEMISNFDRWKSMRGIAPLTQKQKQIFRMLRNISLQQSKIPFKTKYIFA